MSTAPDTPAINSTDYRSGRVIHGLPFSLAKHNAVSIGSDRGCDIVIDGADPRHAELRWDENDAAWRVYDNPAPGSTIVNGHPVESILLHDGDWFEVADVRIGYANASLKELDSSEPVGLRVTLRAVSVTAGGKRRLDNVSFQVREGAFVALLGPSGCGKSTLIQRIAGLAPFDGDIRFNGHDLRKDKARLLPVVAYLPQSVEETLHVDMTVREAMENFARCHLAADAKPDFSAKLRDVGLDWHQLQGTAVGKLSGGQKRRLALALALMRDPQLLLLDEPTAGLDPAAEAGIMELLRGIANQKRTVICATHVLGSLGLCNEVSVLSRNGRLAFHGTPNAALAYFGARDWLGVYRRLAEDDWGHFEADSPCDKEPRSLPAAPRAASFGSSFAATFRRLVGSVFSKRNAPLFLGSPLGISVVLLLACWSIFDGGKMGTVYFCMAVAMFWLGLSGNVRSLVAERVPKRCLDRMRGMPLARYFAAHVAFAAVAAFAQALLFVVPVFLLKLGHKPFSLAAFPAFWAVLALIGFAGSCVGLFVSALAKKELQAVWTLPFIAVLALFLGKPVLEGGRGEKPTGLLRVVERAMPTYHTQNVLETTMDVARGMTSFTVDGKDTLPSANASNWGWFALLAAAYPAVFLTLAYLLQNRRELQWDGR